MIAYQRPDPGLVSVFEHGSDIAVVSVQLQNPFRLAFCDNPGKGGLSCLTRAEDCHYLFLLEGFPYFILDKTGYHMRYFLGAR